MPQFLTRKDLETLDREDELASFRDRFQLPGQGLYFNGNSLGPRPLATSDAMNEVLEDHWGKKGGASWHDEDWMERPFRVGDKIAQLIGAGLGEVVIAESTSLNLAKMVLLGLSLRPDRKVIVTEKGNFPTDLYILKDIVKRTPGLELRVVERADLMTAMDRDCALLVLTHVNYKSSERHDMKALTARAHDVGVLALWDLSHSSGAVAVDLNACDVDLAVGCTYKFLNGGPGAPAFLFVAERHHHADPALPGWMGHEAPFDFSSDYQPKQGIARFLSGTPPILALASLECGVDMMVEAGIEKVAAKSSALGDYFIQLVEQQLSDCDITNISPVKSDDRGAQICLKTNHAQALVQALEHRGIIADFRPPNIIRFGLAALYVRYQDLWDVVQALKDEYKRLISC